jgi:hypothetical protein
MCTMTANGGIPKIPKVMVESSAWRARPLARIALALPHPLPQRFGRAPDLGRNRADRGPLGGMVTPMLQHHS